jgi:pimeloyl-ACP methyl ester carboxylesterase
MQEDDHGRTSSSWWKAIVAVMLAAFCVWIFLSADPLRAYMQAAAIFFELNSNHVPLVLAPVAHHPADVSNVEIPVPGHRALRGAIYAPTDVKSARAIVLLHGVHHLGYDEPRLVNFASALARCGFQVLTPELSDLRDYHITPASLSDIRASIDWYAQRTGGPVTVIGLSFAGGLAILAASDPETAPHVEAILSVGGHASFARVADYYVTGVAHGTDGSNYTVPPHDYGSLVLAYDHLGDYIPAQDTGAVLPVLRAHLYENAEAEKSLTAQLNPRQQTEIHQIEQFNLPAEITLAKASNSRLASAMAAISPEGNVATLRAPVFLLHGSADDVIPPTELSWLKKDLPPGTVHGALVTPLLSHVSLQMEKPTFGDDWRALRFLAHFLEMASA